MLESLKKEIKLNPRKKNLLFSATWDGSGMSAIHLWHDRVGELADTYNIMVTLHRMMSRKYTDSIKNNGNIIFIENTELIPHIMISDVCISDTTSLIAEFCMLNKPVITFRTQKTARTMSDVERMIDKISMRIDSFEQLRRMVEMLVDNPKEYTRNHREMVRITLGEPDGRAGLRAAQHIVKLIPELSK
jgi:CDP-glycerol glycerophosphotransferase (TagB/SpsB family)